MDNHNLTFQDLHNQTLRLRNDQRTDTDAAITEIWDALGRIEADAGRLYVHHAKRGTAGFDPKWATYKQDIKVMGDPVESIKQWRYVWFLVQPRPYAASLPSDMVYEKHSVDDAFGKNRPTNSPDGHRIFYPNEPVTHGIQDPSQWRQRAEDLLFALNVLIKLEGGVPADVQESNNITPGKIPRLQPHDRQAWQMSLMQGKKQEDIAKKLNREHGTDYKQGQVSRMIKRAKNHAEMSGLADKLSAPAKIQTMDPHKLEIGERTDHRSREQRQTVK